MSLDKKVRGQRAGNDACRDVYLLAVNVNAALSLTDSQVTGDALPLKTSRRHFILLILTLHKHKQLQTCISAQTHSNLRKQFVFFYIILKNNLFVQKNKKIISFITYYCNIICAKKKKYKYYLSYLILLYNKNRVFVYKYLN